jgi:hypothetical protein
MILITNSLYRLIQHITKALLDRVLSEQSWSVAPTGVYNPNMNMYNIVCAQHDMDRLIGRRVVEKAQKINKDQQQLMALMRSHSSVSGSPRSVTRSNSQLDRVVVRYFTRWSKASKCKLCMNSVVCRHIKKITEYYSSKM